MKICLTLLIFVNFLFSNEPYNYNPFQVKVIKKEKNKPIIVEKIEPKVVAKKRVSFRIDAIMDKRAFVNGNWYKIGDKIGEYTLYMIRPKVIGFKSGEKLYIQPIGSGQSVLSIKEKK